MFREFYKDVTSNVVSAVVFYWVVFANLVCITAGIIDLFN